MLINLSLIFDSFTVNVLGLSVRAGEQAGV